MALVAAALATWGAAAPVGAAGSSVTVTATVLSATSLDVSGCLSGTANVTTLGTVLPGASAVTSADCRLTWGSSNDTASVRMFQADRSGSAMFSPTVGALDPTFGTGGKVTTSFSAGPDYANEGIVVQPDGKIVSAGEAYNGSGWDVVVARYNADGTLDASFGTAGKVTAPTGAANNYGGGGVALQPDGKILVSASSTNAGSEDLALLRVNADGTMDTTFGAAGTVTTHVGSGDNRAVGGLVVQPDGKILTAGGANGPYWVFAVVRHNADGTLDTTFGSGGKVVTSFGSAADYPDGGLALQRDGKILLAGRVLFGTWDFAMVRYSIDGTLDTGFGTGGKVVQPVGSSDDHAIGGVVVQPDGKIVSAGSSLTGGNYEFALVRYGPTGALDASFGVGGKVLTPVGTANTTYANGGLVLQPDGKLIMAASASGGGSANFTLVRYDPNGTVDSTFGTSGKVSVPAGGGVTYSWHGVTIADGAVYMNGTIDGDFALIKLGAPKIPNYAAGSPNWAAGASGMFGACLRDATGAGVVALWSLGVTCPATDGAYWKAVPQTSASATATLARSTTPGLGVATADLRFGLRPGLGQAPGAYQAPIVFEVSAPGV